MADRLVMTNELAEGKSIDDAPAIHAHGGTLTWERLVGALECVIPGVAAAVVRLASAVAVICAVPTGRLDGRQNPGGGGSIVFEHRLPAQTSVTQV